MINKFMCKNCDHQFVCEKLTTLLKFDESAKKDLKELPALRDFVADGAKENMLIGKKGYSAAFSTSRKGFDSGALIANIKANADFVSLVEHEALLIVAVDVNG